MHAAKQPGVSYAEQAVHAIKQPGVSYAEHVVHAIKQPGVIYGLPHRCLQTEHSQSQWAAWQMEADKPAANQRASTDPAPHLNHKA